MLPSQSTFEATANSWQALAVDLKLNVSIQFERESDTLLFTLNMMLIGVKVHDTNVPSHVHLMYSHHLKSVHTCPQLQHSSDLFTVCTANV